MDDLRIAGGFVDGDAPPGVSLTEEIARLRIDTAIAQAKSLGKLAALADAVEAAMRVLAALP